MMNSLVAFYLMTKEHSAEGIKNYSDFWKFYLSQHSKAGTRYVHILSTIVGVLLGSYYLLHLDFVRFMFLVPILYFIVWLSHFFIECNKPATFKHPLWSFISDFRMVFLFLIGKLR